jgi:DNA-binding transcriptional ArsR family regulator
MKDKHAELRDHFRGNEVLCKKVVTVFSFLSNKARFRILCLLNEGDFCVQEIVDIIEAGNLSFVSQQLKALTYAGVLEKRKEGKRVYYSMKDEKIRVLIKFLQSQYMEKRKRAKRRGG